MVQGLKELFNQAKMIEKRNWSSAENAKLQSYIHLLNEMGLVLDMFLEVVQLFIKLPSTHTALIALCEDMRLSWLQSP